MELAEPVLLARLPRSINAHGKTYVGPVWGLRDGIKRKRHEVCAAVDGDSVSIYEIRHGKVLLSHPVSPATSFVEAPCSIRWRDDNADYRQTYCVLKEQGLRLHSFLVQEGQTQKRVSETSVELEESSSTVVLLNVRSTSFGHEVVILQQDGTLSIFSKDLTAKLWSRKIYTDDKAIGKVCTAELFDLATARMHLLKARTDVVAVSNEGTTFLATVHESHEMDSSGNLIPKLHYSVYSIDSSSAHLEPNQLLEHDIEGLLGIDGSANLGPGSICFGHRGSTLNVGTPQAFVILDLSTIVPQKVAALRRSQGAYHDALAISTSFMIASYPGSVRLYDIKFETVQASIEVKKTREKRKRLESEDSLSSGPIELLGYHPRLSRCLAIRRHNLLAIDLHLTIGSNGTHNLEKMALLSNSVGRGTRSHEIEADVQDPLPMLGIGQPHQLHHAPNDWQETRKRLEQYARSGDLDNFEKLAVEDLQRLAQAVPGLGKTTSPLPATGRHVPDVKVNYLLSRMFKIQAVGDDAYSGKGPVRKLVLCLPARKILAWLSHVGLMTNQRLRQALRSSGAAGDLFLNPGDIATALISKDSTLDLLIVHLQSNTTPDIREQAAAVRAVISHALGQGWDEDKMGLLEEQTQSATRYSDLETPKDEAQDTRSLSQASPNNSNLPEALVQALVLILNKFGLAGPSEITSQIRALFSQTQILALIQFLRQQLFNSGHTRSALTSTDADSPASEHNDAMIVSTQARVPSPSGQVNLVAIVRILSGCVDALGPLGVFGSEDEDNFVESIIPDLVSEIDRTVQALADAAEMQGILRETLRYVESLHQQSKVGGQLFTTKHDDSVAPRPGTIITLFSERGEEMENGEDATSLPMSLQAERMVNPLKVRKGGGQVSRRSVRERLMLESRLKGPYSFERLIL